MNYELTPRRNNNTILENRDGEIGCFKFLFILYVTFIVFSGKIRSISWLLCNTGKYFLKAVLKNSSR